jgi:hypothetical protein
MFRRRSPFYARLWALGSRYAIGTMYCPKVQVFYQDIKHSRKSGVISSLEADDLKGTKQNILKLS